MTTRDELKPCPFCGGEPYFNKAEYSDRMVKEQEWDQSVFHGVNCINCGVSNLGLVGHKDQQRAAAKWNARASRQEVSVTVEEIKEIIRRELTDEQTCYEFGTRTTPDVLVAGCAAVGYGVPTSPEVAADKFAELVASALLAEYSITKLEG